MTRTGAFFIGKSVLETVTYLLGYNIAAGFLKKL